MTLVKNGLRSSLGALVALAACGLVALGCERKDEPREEVDTTEGEVEGAFGEAKEDIEQAARKGYDKLEEGTDRALEKLDASGERAEESVEETGRDLHQAGEEAVEETREAAEHAGDEIDEATDYTGEKVDEAAEETEQAARDVEEDAAESADEAAEETEAAGEKTAGELDEGLEGVQHDAERTDEQTSETAEGVEGSTEGAVGAVTGGAVALASSEAAERLSTCDLDEPFEIFFERGSNRPSGENLSRAEKIGDCVKSEGLADKSVIVMAYADADSGAASGLDLAINRGKNVAQTLLDKGVLPENLLIQASPGGDKTSNKGEEYARHTTIIVR